jgi:hypothetical protein
VVAGHAGLISLIRDVRHVLGEVCDPHAGYLVHRGMKTMARRVAHQIRMAMHGGTEIDRRTRSSDPRAMTRSVAILGMATLLAACGGDGSAGAASAGNGANAGHSDAMAGVGGGSQAGTSGSAAGTDGGSDGGSSGGDGGASAGSGAAGSGGASGTADPVDDVTGCLSGKHACNGYCFAERQAARGCIRLLTGIRGMAVRPGEVVASTDEGLIVLQTGTWQARAIEGSPQAHEILAHDGKLYLALDRRLSVFDEQMGMQSPLHDAQGRVERLHVAGDHLYFLEVAFPSSKLFRVPLAGGTAEELRTNVIDHVIVGNQLVYATENSWGDRTLEIAPLVALQDATTLEGSFRTTRFAVHAGYAYWREPGRLWRISIGGGTKEAVANLQESDMIGAAAGVMFHSEVAWFNQEANLRSTRVSRAALSDHVTVERIFEGLNGVPELATELDGTAFVVAGGTLFAVTLGGV